MTATLTDKLNELVTVINDIEQISPQAAAILMEGLGISLKTMQVVLEKGDRQVLDIDEQIQMVTTALGVDFTTIVEHVINNLSEPVSSSKEPDKATLDFITSNVDDYEKFLAENKVKDNLEFLSKEL